jgi:hypothetical protein
VASGWQVGSTVSGRKEREGVTVRGRFGWAVGLIGTGPVWPFGPVLLFFFFLF